MTGQRAQTAWAVGLFEGEGCMCIEQGGRRVNLTLQMTDEDVVRRFAAIVGTGRVTGPHTPTNKNAKLQWRWRCGVQDDIRSFIEDAYPLFGERRRAKADEVLAYLDEQAAKREPRTHCGEGHELTPENTIVRRDRRDYEYKRCRTCFNAWNRDYLRRRRELQGAAV